MTGDSGQCKYIFAGKTITCRCGRPAVPAHRHGDWRDLVTNERVTTPSR